MCRRLRITPIRPSLTIQEILTWADEWFETKRCWPNINSGLIPGTIDDTWGRIDDALRKGYRGLRRRSGLSLARLLKARRGVRNSEYPPRLSKSRIVQWARRHRKRTGTWPKATGGDIRGVPGETWMAVDMSLRKGKRGVGPGSSLARLLADRCGVRNGQRLPPLSIASILRWADDYYTRHGKRPTSTSGKIRGTLGETWHTIDNALVRGRRGLSGGSSLALLLDERRSRWKPLRRRMEG